MTNPGVQQHVQYGISSINFCRKAQLPVLLPVPAVPLFSLRVHIHLLPLSPHPTLQAVLTTGQGEWALVCAYFSRGTGTVGTVTFCLSGTETVITFLVPVTVPEP
jgi:hypothetical protein